MSTLKDFNRFGEELERLFMLRTSPLAVKMLEKAEDIPKGAFRPCKNEGIHIAQCQAFAMSRRDKLTVAMLNEDHWCPAPLMAYGTVEPPEVRMGHPYESFEQGKYVGILTAPLKTSSFKPDVVVVYSNTSQLRSLLLSMKIEDIPSINGYFFPPSCAHAVVNPILSGQYSVVLPDPGEYQRALTGEDEMMFSIPKNKVEYFLSNLSGYEEKIFSYTNHHMLMIHDFPQPDHYKKLFKKWGLMSEE
jgi:uncharacterized protein (DUF169 family)